MKKRVRHTHSARMFRRQSDETGNLDPELYFWKIRSHTPCPLLAFISFFINQGLGVLTYSVATLLAINTFTNTLFIAFICKYGPLQTGCDNYSD